MQSINQSINFEYYMYIYSIELPKEQSAYRLIAGSHAPNNDIYFRIIGRESKTSIIIHILSFIGLDYIQRIS